MKKKTQPQKITLEQIVTDIHAQKRNADARKGTPARVGRRGQAAPVPAVPEVLQLQPPAGSAHQGPYWRKTIQMLVL